MGQGQGKAPARLREFIALHYTPPAAGAIKSRADRRFPPMTGTLRSTARNPVAIALMGLLILVFLVIGVGGNGRFPDAFRANRADAVVSAGAHSMGASDFRRLFDQQKQKLEADNKQTIASAVLVENGFDQQILTAIAQDESLAEMLQRSGVTPGEALVDEQIRKLPFAFDRVTGKFSEQQFDQFLQSQGLTARQAQQELGDELAQRHFVYAAEAGFRAPRIFAALNAAAGLENRDIAYFIVNPNIIPTPAAPTDAQLGAFMKEHAAQLMRPEMRTITLVRFSATALAPTTNVDEAAIAKEFEFRKSTLAAPETRSVAQIPVKTPAQGADAAARLAKGEDPGAIARSYGVQAIVYADKPQSALADRKLAAAVFALKAGETRGPLQGDLGLAAVRVFKVTPAKIVTLADARPKIEADLKQKAARNRAYEMSQVYDDAKSGGASLADAAAKAGAAPVIIGPFAAGGQDLHGQPIAGLDEKIIKSAFAKHVGEDADLEDAGSGEYFALKVNQVTPPALPALQEARPQLAKAYQTQLFMQALRSKADGLLAELRAGMTIEKAAASVGATVVRQAGLQRIAAARYQALGRGFLEAIFAAKPGNAFAAGAPNGVYIAKLEAVRAGDPTAMANVVNAIRGRLGEGYLAELTAAAKSAAQAEVKAQINLPLARQAIGVDPALAPKPGAKAPPSR